MCTSADFACSCTCGVSGHSSGSAILLGMKSSHRTSLQSRLTNDTTESKLVEVSLVYNSTQPGASGHLWISGCGGGNSNPTGQEGWWKSVFVEPMLQEEITSGSGLFRDF